MFTNFARFIICLIAWSLVGANFVFGVVTEPHYKALMPGGYTHSQLYAYVNKPWIEDDRPYAKIRVDVEKAMSNTDRRTYLIKLALAHKKHPEDVEARYAWALGTVIYAFNDPMLNNGEKESLLGSVTWELSTSKSPDTFNYARIHFLADAPSSGDPTLAPLGRKLLAVSPQDYMVQYEVSLLCLNGLHPDFSEVRKIAYDMIREDPHGPDAWELLGFSSLIQWEVGHKQSDARAAIAAYSQYIKRLRKTDFGTMHAKGIIMQVRSEMSAKRATK